MIPLRNIDEINSNYVKAIKFCMTKSSHNKIRSKHGGTDDVAKQLKRKKQTREKAERSSLPQNLIEYKNRWQKLRESSLETKHNIGKTSQTWNSKTNMKQIWKAVKNERCCKTK